MTLLESKYKVDTFKVVVKQIEIFLIKINRERYFIITLNQCFLGFGKNTITYI